VIGTPTRAYGAPDLVETWLVSLAPPVTREPGWWWDLLDAEETARAGRWRRPADRVRYVARHVALRLILAERLGVDPATVAFERAPCPLCGELHGRPQLRDRDDVHFSLSSTGDVAAVAVAPAVSDELALRRRTRAVG